MIHCTTLTATLQKHLVHLNLSSRHLVAAVEAELQGVGLLLRELL